MGARYTRRREVDTLNITILLKILRIYIYMYTLYVCISYSIFPLPLFLDSLLAFPRPCPSLTPPFLPCSRVSKPKTYGLYAPSLHSSTLQILLHLGKTPNPQPFLCKTAPRRATVVQRRSGKVCLSRGCQAFSHLNEPYAPCNLLNLTKFEIFKA